MVARTLDQVIEQLRTIYGLVGVTALARVAAVLREIEAQHEQEHASPVLDVEPLTQPAFDVTAASVQVSPADMVADASAPHIDLTDIASEVAALLFESTEPIKADLAAALLENDRPHVIPASEFPPQMPEGTRFGHYIVHKALGHGSSHEVYLARDTTALFKHMVVLHVPRRQDDDLKWLETQRELADVWRKTRHASVLPFEGLKLVEGRMVYVTDRLDDRVTHPPPIGYRDLVPHLVSLCDAFATLHAAQVSVTRKVVLTSDGPMFRGPFVGSSRPPMQDIGEMVGWLLTGTPASAWPAPARPIDGLPAWLETFVQRCLSTGPDRFANLPALLDYARFYSDPVSASRVTLTAIPQGAGGIDYLANCALATTSPRVQRRAMKFHASAEDATLQGLVKRWHDVGDLSVDRWQLVSNGAHPSRRAEIERKIQRSTHQIGNVGGRQVVGKGLRRKLSALGPETTLTWIHAGGLDQLPWEIFDVRGPLGLRFASTRLIPEEISPIDWSGDRSAWSPDRVVLLLGDWSEKDCMQEVEELAALFRRAGITPTLVNTALEPIDLRELISCAEILHFAGHGTRFPSGASSSLVLRWNGNEPQDVIDGDDLEELWAIDPSSSAYGPPRLLFANACHMHIDFVRAACKGRRRQRPWHVARSAEIRRHHRLRRRVLHPLAARPRHQPGRPRSPSSSPCHARPGGSDLGALRLVR